MPVSHPRRRRFPLLAPSSFDPLVFVFLSLVFPMGNVVTFQSLWKPGRIEMGTHPLPILSLSPLFSTVARRCSSRCLSSSRIRLVFFLPSSLSLSLLVPRSCRSRSHLSLIRPACQPALSFSSLFSPFPLPVARSR